MALNQSDSWLYARIIIKNLGHMGGNCFGCGPLAKERHWHPLMWWAYAFLLDKRPLTVKWLGTVRQQPHIASQGLQTLCGLSTSRSQRGLRIDTERTDRHTRCCSVIRIWPLDVNKGCLFSRPTLEFKVAREWTGRRQGSPRCKGCPALGFGTILLAQACIPLSQRAS